jgi:hypothetical protein
MSESKPPVDVVEVDGTKFTVLEWDFKPEHLVLSIDPSEYENYHEIGQGEYSIKLPTGEVSHCEYRSLTLEHQTLAVWFTPLADSPTADHVELNPNEIPLTDSEAEIAGLEPADPLECENCQTGQYVLTFRSGSNLGYLFSNYVCPDCGHDVSKRGDYDEE